jgi:hypothetical protein
MVLSESAQAEWMRQWLVAAQVLADDRRARLARLTRKEGLAYSEAVLSLAGSTPVNVARRTTSGLVEQQAFFQRQRSQ